MNRTEAKQKGLLVYNNGRKCKKGHDPTLRVTTTGRCMQCEKDYHLERRNTQKKRSRYDRRTSKYFYIFVFPDGEKMHIGPFATHQAAIGAMERRWKVFYGVPFDIRILSRCRKD